MLDKFGAEAEICRYEVCPNKAEIDSIYSHIFLEDLCSVGRNDNSREFNYE